MKGLLKLDVEVTLFSINTTSNRIDVEDIEDPLFDEIRFYSHPVDTDINLWGMLLNVFSDESYHVSRYFDEDAAKLLENILHEQEFDMIQFEGLFVVPYLDVVKAHSKAKLIYRAHNIVFDVWERLAYTERSIPRRRYLEFLARRLKSYETEQINRFNQIFAISEPDRQSILRLGCETKLEVFPVALDMEKYITEPVNYAFPTLFHLGAMDWQPNREGLEWFLDEIWPDIEKLNSELRFYIAGKHMQQQFFDYDSDNVVVEGEVLDAVEFINSKAIMIVPLLSGSGMRVKIIEGMAMRKCIIATTMAAEGIICEHGKDILIANTPDEFYRSILQCITNPGRITEIGENARKTVEKHYNITTISQRMLQIYQQIINV